MNIKIQGGGGGAYANTGSCFGVVSYLRHEDANRQEHGQEVEPFFDQYGNVPSRKVTEKIDNNKAKLSKTDSKFYVITVSPSAKELQTMGKDVQEQTQAFREYINSDVMQQYAAGFDKGLNNNDIMYFAKIHHERKEGEKMDMHAHIIVSRKDMSNTKKISPQTNHRGNDGRSTGTIKGGFNRSEFYSQAEQSFDSRFNHRRDYRESYEYQNAIKNGVLQDKQNAINKAVQQEKTKEMKQQVEQKQEIKKEIKQEKQQNKGLRR